MWGGGGVQRASHNIVDINIESGINRFLYIHKAYSYFFLSFSFEGAKSEKKASKFDLFQKEERFNTSWMLNYQSFASKIIQNKELKPLVKTNNANRIKIIAWHAILQNC